MHTNRFTLGSILGILVLALLPGLGLAGCTPERIASLAGKIADFDVPQGFSPELGLEADGCILVGYAPTTGQGHLYLFQAPPTAQMDADKLQNGMRSYQPVSKSGRTMVVDTLPIEIRGQSVTLVVSEGTNSDGKIYQEYTAVFAGKGGPALVSITSIEASWSEAEVTSFLTSIR